MVRLLRYRSLTSLSSDSSNLRRAYSEANIPSSSADTSHSFLKVNQSQATVGEKVVLSWNINDAHSDKDWIGLFYEDDGQIKNALDTRSRAIGRSKQGSVIWSIAKDIAFRSAINYCCFKYINGVTGAALATSQSFPIYMPLSMMPKKMPSRTDIGADSLLVVSISGLCAKDLRKGFFGKPNPYVRMCIVPRFRGLAVIQRYHGQQVKTLAQNNTVCPSWQNEVFVFHATPADFFEVEIRNKSGTKFSKFLGKISFPLCTIMDSCGYNKFRTVTLPLSGRNPSDKVQGSFTFTIFVRKSTVSKPEEQGATTEHRKHHSMHVPETRHAADMTNAPLDDMALPRNEQKETSAQKRPSSYHPSSSYASHSATEPRKRIESSNYFESAAFRNQGWPTISETPLHPAPTANHSDERHEALSSQDEQSDYSDEEETGQQPAETAAVNDPEVRQQNGHLEARRTTSAPVKSQAAASTGTHNDVPTPPPAPISTNADDNESSDPAPKDGARNVVQLLKFKDQGSSFAEFVQQQAALSASESENSEPEDSDSDEDVEESSVSVSEEAAERGLPADTSPEEEEVAADVPGSRNPTTDSQPGEEDADATDNDDHSSEMSGGPDEGTDGTELGYVEIGPGIMDDETDSGSTFSDADDDVYVGNSAPRASMESNFIGQGDLLTECLDMLTGVGYGDLQTEDNTANTEVNADVITWSQNEDIEDEEARQASTLEEPSEIEDDQVSVQQADESGESTQSEVGAPLSESVAEGTNDDFSASLSVATSTDASVSNASSYQEASSKEQTSSIGNVLSVLDDITSHAKSLMITPIEHDEQRESAADDAVCSFGNVDAAAEDIQSDVDETQLTTKEDEKDPNNRNKSYCKAIFGSSLEENNNDSHTKARLTKRRSSPAALLSMPSYRAVASDLFQSSSGHAGGTPSVSNTPNRGKNLQASLHEIIASAFSDGIGASSSLIDTSGATSSGDADSGMISAVDNSDESTEVISSHDRSSSDCESALFSSRHRILRDSNSSDTSSAISSTMPSASNAPSERHKITNRTDIGAGFNSVNNGTKLRHSVSDPISKNGLNISKQRREHKLNNAEANTELDIQLFNIDLRESVVDDVDLYGDEGLLTSGMAESKPVAPRTKLSNAVSLDAASLKESVKSMRETAILSSNEDISRSEDIPRAKNRPIGRTDQAQPVEKTDAVPSSSAFRGDRQQPQRRSLRDTPLQRTQPDIPITEINIPELMRAGNAAAVAENSVVCQAPEQAFTGIHGAEKTRITGAHALEHKDKPKPPPVPPRGPPTDVRTEESGPSRVVDAKERVPPSVDPWRNVTARRQRPPRDYDDATAVPASHGKPSNAEQHANKETRSRTESPEEAPAFADLDSASTYVLSILAQTTPKAAPAVRDQSASTKPRPPERARAIQRTTSAANDVSLFNNASLEARQRGTPQGRNGQQGTSSSLEQQQQRARSPSEPAISFSQFSTRPPAIPPRIDRQKPAAVDGGARHSGHAQAKAPITQSSSLQPSDVVRKRTDKDVVSRERREEQRGGSSKQANKNSHPTQPALRSPAIIHSENPAKGSANQSNNVDENGELLPSHWERAVDSHGRIYYIDHIARATTWHRPRKGAQTASDANSSAQLQQQHLQQYDRRYQSLRRTMRGQRRGGESNRPTILPPESRSSEPEPPRDRPRHLSRKAQPDNTANRPKPEPTPEPTVPDGPERRVQTSTLERRERGSFQNTPGCKFIRRRDFFQFVNNHGMASQFLHRNTSLKQMVNRIRADPSKFERYQHSRDLVTLLNFFSNETAELVAGWEKKSDQHGQTYFIDHNTRSTTFIDPRLPVESAESTTSGPRNRPNPNAANSSGTPEASNAKRPRGASTAAAAPSRRTPSGQPASSRAKASVPAAHTVIPEPVSYNERVVSFLRQPAIEDILKRKDVNIMAKNALRRKIMVIQRDGLRALERLSNDIELVMLLSIFEDEIQSFVSPSLVADDVSSPEPKESFPKDASKGPPQGRKPAPYRRDFEAKLRTFHRQMVQSGYGQGPGKIRMKIRRDHVVEDAFEQLMKQSPRALQKDRLYIKFLGEEGLDYGGPAREFFFLISRQLFDPYYGLFEYSASDTYTLQISPVAARFVSNSRAWLRFCGRIIGLSLVHQHLLDVFFTRTIYKALLRQSYDLSDLESFDPEFHQSLSWILENDITDVLDMYFTTDEKVFDQVTERELKPGGRSIPVTEQNKHEYAELMIKWRMERGVAEQMNHMVQGFNEVLDLHMISIFDARELELVIAGTADIDVKDWRANTDYRSGYHDKHPVIQWFWKAVDLVNNEQRLRLLQFVTGTSSIPFEGFSALRGSTGPRKFTIDCWGDPNMLPRAHTCFNRLDLPPYKNFEELHEKMLYAVEETSSFGIE